MLPAALGLVATPTAPHTNQLSADMLRQQLSVNRSAAQFQRGAQHGAPHYGAQHGAPHYGAQHGAPQYGAQHGALPLPTPAGETTSGNKSAAALLRQQLMGRR